MQQHTPHSLIHQAFEAAAERIARPQIDKLRHQPLCNTNHRLDELDRSPVRCQGGPLNDFSASSFVPSRPPSNRIPRMISIPAAEVKKQATLFSCIIERSRFQLDETSDDCSRVCDGYYDSCEAMELLHHRKRDGGVDDMCCVRHG